MMISELDKKILKSLNQNARKSFREVATEVGTSTTSIYNNVKKLEKMGVIKGYIPLLDEEVMGNEFAALISLRFTQGKWKEVIDEISKLPQVRAVYDVTGEMDLICICYFSGRKDLDEFLKYQLQLPYVERVLTHIVLNVYKDERRTIFRES